MTTPTVYVGTYGKYNNGSIEGAWLDLEDYADKDKFLEACQALHGPGEHEFMFQDHTGIPDKYISESHISDDAWEEWVDLDEDDRELLEMYLEEVDAGGTLEDARESFSGKYPSRDYWAEEFWQETGMLRDIPEGLQMYIDYDAYARDCEMNGDMAFVSKGGEVWAFRKNI